MKSANDSTSPGLNGGEDFRQAFASILSVRQRYTAIGSTITASLIFISPEIERFYLMLVARLWIQRRQRYANSHKSDSSPQRWSTLDQCWVFYFWWRRYR